MLPALLSEFNSSPWPVGIATWKVVALVGFGNDTTWTTRCPARLIDLMPPTLSRFTLDADDGH